ncbi:hypothetical protein JB92DRAFT_3099191, partial [Gautieria morchelliformis]
MTTMHSSTRRALFAYAVFLGFAFTTNAQGNVPQCVTTCLSIASTQVGCAGPMDFACACPLSSFMSNVDRCFSSTCTTAQAQIGQSFIDTSCSNEASTSIPAPFSPPASSSSLTVTNSETSPPQSSQGPLPTSNTLAPPTPPLSTTTVMSTATQPAPISTVVPPQSTGSSGGSGTPLPSSITIGTNTTTATNATTAPNITLGTSQSSGATTTVPSGSIQSIPTSTSSSGAFRL